MQKMRRKLDILPLFCDQILEVHYFSNVVHADWRDLGKLEKITNPAAAAFSEIFIFPIFVCTILKPLTFIPTISQVQSVYLCNT